MSGNTIGASFWTDGKCEAPMLPETPWLVKCPTCGQLVWLDEAKELGERPFGRSSLWPGVHEYVELYELDYLEALTTNFSDSLEKVHYMRMRAWWAANDRLRIQTNEGTTSPSGETRENMESLFTSLSEADEQQRLMKAELARELGQFEEAERLLSVKYSDQLQQAVERISELVNQRIACVAILY